MLITNVFDDTTPSEEGILPQQQQQVAINAALLMPSNSPTLGPKAYSSPRTPTNIAPQHVVAPASTDATPSTTQSTVNIIPVIAKRKLLLEDDIEDQSNLVQIPITAKGKQNALIISPQFESQDDTPPPAKRHTTPPSSDT